jgi:hypothetical protein
MKSSSNQPPSDKSRRGARTAPRRHVDPAEKQATTYDSSEFPVLLRMPDISFLANQVLTAAANDSDADVEHHHGGAIEEVEGDLAPQQHIRRYHRHGRGETSGSDRTTITAGAADRFWATLAPKIAVGGMLLAVTALCVVMLQGPRQSDLDDSGTSRWAEQSDFPSMGEKVIPPESSHTFPVAVPTPANSSSQGNSIAVKPELPRMLGGNRGDVTVGQVDLQSSVPQPTTTSQDRATPTWSNEVTPQAPSARAPSLDQPYQAQGWPDDMDSTPEPPADSELQLNAAAKAALRTRVVPGNESIPSTTPPGQGGAGTRLNGTVELPNPRVDYRL